MNEKYFTSDEKKTLLQLSRSMLRSLREVLESDDVENVRKTISEGIGQNQCRRDRYGINPTIHNLQTAALLCEKIGPDRNMVIAILLHSLCKTEFITSKKLL